MPDDWTGRSIEAAQSRGSVVAVADFSDNLMRVDSLRGVPHPEYDVRPRKAGGETCAVSALREAERNFVSKKGGNPNWGKPEVNAVPYAGASSFEEVVKKLRLSPTEYESSTKLKDWVRKNKDRKYAPLTLLQAWGLDVKGES